VAGIIYDHRPAPAVRGVAVIALTRPSLPVVPWYQRPALTAPGRAKHTTYFTCCASINGKLLVASGPTMGLDSRYSRLICCNSWRSSWVKMNTSRTNHLGLHGLASRCLTMVSALVLTYCCQSGSSGSGSARKPLDGAWVESQPLIPRGEQSGLFMRIVMTESVTWCGQRTS
jgi:hypothetical protein